MPEHQQNFPGNPYAETNFSRLADANAREVSNALRLLAFEQRTANLIAAAAAGVKGGPDAADRVRDRLGL